MKFLPTRQKLDAKFLSFNFDNLTQFLQIKLTLFMLVFLKIIFLIHFNQNCLSENDYFVLFFCLHVLILKKKRIDCTFLIDY